ncbi:hypothetical protein DW66_2751 [Pseudomonas putida]|nr:hypothetical protein DW66_2751 [Pseudomonas putida]
MILDGQVIVAAPVILMMAVIARVASGALLMERVRGVLAST